MKLLKNLNIALLCSALLIVGGIGCASIPGTYFPSGHQYAKLRKNFEVTVLLAEDPNLEFEKLGTYETDSGDLDKRIKDAQTVARRQGGNVILYIGEVEHVDELTQEATYVTQFSILRATDYYGWTTEDAAIKIPKDSARIDLVAEPEEGDADEQADTQTAAPEKPVTNADGSAAEPEEAVSKNPFK
jgi:hypothetical protein